MALLGLSEIKARIQNDGLVVNLGERDLHNPEGCGVDLRLGSLHKITEGGAFIEADGVAGQGLRKGVKTEELASFVEGADTQADVSIEPGAYYLMQTVESVNTPLDLMPMVYPRSSLFRAGILFLATKTDPGYAGKLTFGLTNLSPFPVRLQMGARVCNMVFYTIEGETVSYRGQHQGGRVTPQDVERQV